MKRNTHKSNKTKLQNDVNKREVLELRKMLGLPKIDISKEKEKLCEIDQLTQQVCKSQPQFSNINPLKYIDHLNISIITQIADDNRMLQQLTSISKRFSRLESQIKKINQPDTKQTQQMNYGVEAKTNIA